MRVLMVTSEWPTAENPGFVPFVVEQVEHLRRAGVEVEVFSFRGAHRPRRYLAAWRDLRRRHDLRGYDVVHAQFGQSGLVALPAPVPVVVTFHGSDLQGIVNADGRYGLRGRVLTAVSRQVARRADHSILVSEHLARNLPQGLPFDVIPCGIDLERFRPLPRAEARQKLGFKAEGPLVLFGASPSNPIKRFDLARAAVEALPAAERPRLVVLQGITHDDVPLYLNACDALLLTSFHEGSPMVVKEALACDLPVVALPVGDVPERLAGAEGCALVNEPEPAALARALAEVLARGGRAASRRAVEPLGHPQTTRRLCEVYERVTGTAARRAGSPQ